MGVSSQILKFVAYISEEDVSMVVQGCCMHKYFLDLLAFDIKFISNHSCSYADLMSKQYSVRARMTLTPDDESG